LVAVEGHTHIQAEPLQMDYLVVREAVAATAPRPALVGQIKGKEMMAELVQVLLRTTVVGVAVMVARVDPVAVATVAQVVMDLHLLLPDPLWLMLVVAVVVVIQVLAHLPLVAQADPVAVELVLLETVVVKKRKNDELKLRGQTVVNLRGQVVKLRGGQAAVNRRREIESRSGPI
jgi:hypothetical protein